MSKAESALPVTNLHQDREGAGFLSSVEFVDAPNHCFLREGEDDSGSHAIGIWYSTATGVPTGAWVKRVSELSADVDAARKHLGLLSRHTLFDYDAKRAFDTFDLLSKLAGCPEAPRPPVIQFTEVVAEVSACRRMAEIALKEHWQTNPSRLVPLVWRRDIAEGATLNDLISQVGVRREAASPVATDVLHLVKMASWAAELWRDTETVRSRRPYLVKQFGPRQTLPAAWLSKLTTGRGYHVDIG
jgi:hypothetical protein